MRTEGGQSDIVRKIEALKEQGKESEAKALSTYYSTHPVRNAFYGLGKFA